jgi:hypothetical protein
VKVRPAALKNEEAQEARKQHADNGAGEALSGYGVTVLHAYYYYDVTSSLSTSWILVPRNTRRSLRLGRLVVADRSLPSVGM